MPPLRTYVAVASNAPEIRPRESRYRSHAGAARVVSNSPETIRPTWLRGPVSARNVGNKEGELAAGIFQWLKERLERV